MHFNANTIAVVASLLSGALAQTYSACNPLKDYKKCGKDIPALGKSYTWDFSKGKSDQFQATGSADCISYDSEGMHMKVKKHKDSPTLTSDWTIMWGKVDIVMKAAPGAGVISSLVFESKVLDEIDWEWIGSKGEEAQSNYFGKGDTSSYDRGGIHPCPGAMTEFHTYSVEWTKEHIKWSINGKEVRSLLPSQASPNITRYPQTPMAVKLGAWDAGYKGNAKGTVEWAGGYTQYKQGPFDMVVKSITVQDYSEGAKSYTYTDGSGSWESIEISTKEVAKDDDDEDSTASGTAAATGTASAAATTLATGKTSKPTGSAGKGDDTEEETAAAAPDATSTEAGSYGPETGTASATGPVLATQAANAAVSVKAIGSAFAVVAAAAALVL